MNLSHRFLQLGKTASNKIDQALPGFGLVGLLWLIGDEILTFKNLGSPLNSHFWQQYASEIARGDLGRYAGTDFLITDLVGATLGIIAKEKEYSRVALGAGSNIGCSLLFIDAVQKGHWGVAASAAVLFGSNTLLLSGTELLGEKIVDPAINFVKRHSINFDNSNVMTGGYVATCMPMIIDAVRQHDGGLAGVIISWGIAAYIVRQQYRAATNAISKPLIP